MGLNETPRDLPRPPVPATDAGTPRTPPPAAPARDTIRLEIDELVLTGFDRRLDRDLLSAAFQGELTRLLDERGIPTAVEDLSADALSDLPPLPATSSPTRLGRALARAVHDGLTGLSAPSHGPERGRP
ncbi:hypothetical protein SAMN06297387_110176 [Streptomyces zhaozhouensis]|uniref:Uncharacterized protein n=1 Tax=Streptomyces zhaozhouensis TaxID=1300267 RepID=A0A286DY15_9ACTN|nr:hypothetical protein [Streptomyces zhaozhouensis]SOD63444.1 hypothetical protein SAMN06297387_110176 [Streptomyces zhaozhouensis]